MELEFEVATGGADQIQLLQFTEFWMRCSTADMPNHVATFGIPLLRFRFVRWVYLDKGPRCHGLEMHVLTGLCSFHYIARFNHSSEKKR